MEGLAIFFLFFKSIATKIFTKIFFNVTFVSFSNPQAYPKKSVTQIPNYFLKYNNGKIVLVLRVITPIFKRTWE